MGRRSVNSTKAGKFMNPTDQARKEARRRELKKNKKQRQLVREAVIKQKDPRTIIAELDNLDKIEFDTNNPPPYSTKVIEEKRRKLRENLKKIYQFYQKEDAKHAFEIKSIEQDYERRHMQLRSIYESVMQAQRVKLDEIPLPDMDAMPPPPPLSLSSLPFATEAASLGLLMPPLPPPVVAAVGGGGGSSIDFNKQPAKSILKKSTDTSVVSVTVAAPPPGMEPPGPPPGSPPTLDEFECDDDDDDITDEASVLGAKKSIRFGATVESAAPPPPIPTTQLPSSSISAASSVQPPLLPPPAIGATFAGIPGGSSAGYAQVSASAAAAASQRPQNAAMYASKHAQKVQEQASRVAQQIYMQQQQQQLQQLQQQQQQSTIEAKPVLRNKMSEITRFVPTNLIVRRDPNKPVVSAHSYQHEASGMAAGASMHSHADYDFMGKNRTISTHSTSSATKSTDSAYEDFMKEIGKLL